MSAISDDESGDRNASAHVRLHVGAPQPRWVDFMPEFRPGWVWLTGAGPGDPGLLTLQALHALQSADVIFHDALVSAPVLRLVPERTATVFVGKRAGQPSPRQPEITSHLIEHARLGRRVLRLKGGDPFVFGRGAEEAIALAEAHVPFRILPGVTSGIGGLAYAGVPVSHRDFNQAFTFITAHDANGALSANVDWRAVAAAAPVIVIYMGFRLLAAITERLMQEGRRPDEPVAVISKATTPEQRKVVTTLAAAGDDVLRAGIEPPVLIVVGEIVRLHEVLDWSVPLAPLVGEVPRSATTA